MQQTSRQIGRAAVLGAGTMGTALATAIAAGGRRCSMWCESEDVARRIGREGRHPRHFPSQTLPETLLATASLAAALDGAEVAIVAVGSDRVAALTPRLAGVVGAHCIVLSATKGLEPGLGVPMTQLLARHLTGRVIGAISGPNITTDIMAGRPTPLVVASPANAALAAARQHLESPSLRIFGSSDVVGVELLGALKNVVVVALGLAQGLGLGDNARAFLLTLGMLEVNEAVLRLGGRAGTLTGLAGIGDVFLSSTAAFSRNHWIGVEVGKGRPVRDLLRWLEENGETAEGVNTVRLASRIASGVGVDMPLARAMHGVLFEALDARATIEGLLASPEATRRLDAA